MAESNRWKNIVKCYPFEEKRLLTYRPPYLVQYKYDGDRGVDRALDNGKHVLLSSEENIISCLPHIVEALDKLNLPYPADGELYNHQLYLEGGHELIHGICSSQRINPHPRYKEMQFHIFDIQHLALSQMERLHWLIKMTNDIEQFGCLKVAPFWLCESLDEIKRVYDRAMKEKHEGIIIRNLYAPYEINKRSRWIMKFKPKQKDTYRVIGWKEEVSDDGEPKGRIGSILLSSQDGDHFSVSAGLNDEEKA